MVAADRPAKLKSRLSYSESLAISLIDYARHQPHFATFLRQAVAHFSSHDIPRIAKPVYYPDILAPGDIGTAKRRTKWLGEQLANHQVPGAQPAIFRLATWAAVKPREYPQIVIGITPGAIPGITLGRLKIKFTTMTVIIAEQKAKNLTPALLKKILATSLEILSRSFQMVAGNVTNLEPEVGNWFTGERRLALYTADQQTLADIAVELDYFDLVYAKASEEDRLKVLAITPAANQAYLASRYALQPLD